MPFRIRSALLAGAGLLVAVAGATHLLDSAHADAPAPAPVAAQHHRSPTLAPPAESGAQNLILGSQDSAQPQNMAQFLTAVTKDVDTYWTGVFKASGLPEPRVSYDW